MMRLKLWTPKREHEKPPYHAIPFENGYFVMQQQVTELVDVWHEDMRFPKKEAIMVWQDVPLHVEKSDK